MSRTGERLFLAICLVGVTLSVGIVLADAGNKTLQGFTSKIGCAISAPGICAMQQ